MTRTSLEIEEDEIPLTPEELEKYLKDPMWRLCSGRLYKIIIKGDDDDTDGLVLPFRPNRAQRRLMKRLWNRNVILKARQLGFTTLICIMWLDHALFNANSFCGIIAQDRETAEELFLNKVKFAYDNLPPALKAEFPLKSCNKSKIHFAHNNSSIRVATSVRSGTIHRLHISEFGKIGAKYPEKAAEVITGSIPAVPKNGIVVVESTAEGMDGEFFKMCQKAQAHLDAKKTLTLRDYRMHFFPWWKEPNYRMPVEGVIVTPEDNEYFAQVEAAMKTTLDPEQRAWYVATKNSEFSGDEQKMWREYPSTHLEPFKVSTTGTYYANQIAAARREGRYKPSLPVLPGMPCYTFWDIGRSDGTAIWVFQPLDGMWRAIRFYEAWGETYAHAVRWLQAQGVVYQTHFLPHDAAHKRQKMDEASAESPQEMLQRLWPGQSFEIVPKIGDINVGISQTRDIFPLLVFDETQCAAGLAHVELYRKKWSTLTQTWSNEPDKTGGHSEAADGLRQLAQAYAARLINMRMPTAKKKRTGTRNWRTS